MTVFGPKITIVFMMWSRRFRLLRDPNLRFVIFSLNNNASSFFSTFHHSVRDRDNATCSVHAITATRRLPKASCTKEMKTTYWRLMKSTDQEGNFQPRNWNFQLNSREWRNGSDSETNPFDYCRLIEIDVGTLLKQKIFLDLQLMSPPSSLKGFDKKSLFTPSISIQMESVALFNASGCTALLSQRFAASWNVAIGEN